MAIVTTVVVVIANGYWIVLDQFSPYYDQAGHVNLAHIYANIYRGVFPAHGVIGFFTISTYYPPLLHWVAGLVTVVFGFEYQVLQYFGLAFLPLAAWGVYLYGSQISGKKEVGLVAATLLVLFPHIWEQSRYFMLDLPLTVFVVFSLYFLEKSKQFESRWLGILAFGLAGLAQMTKWYAWLYLAVPFAYSLWKSYREKGLGKEKLVTIGLGLVLAAVLVLPWYLINLGDVLAAGALFSRPDYGDPLALVSVANVLFYPFLIANYQVVSVQFVWLLVSLVFFLKQKAAWKWVLLGQVILAYLVFTFVIGNKNLRYIMPLLPLFSIVMAVGIYEVGRKSRGLAVGVLGVLVSFGMGLFVVNSFGWPAEVDRTFAVKLFNRLERLYLLDASSTHVPYAFRQTEWTPGEIPERIYRVTGGKGAQVLVVGNNPWVSVAGIQVFSMKDQYTLHFHDVPYDAVASFESNESMDEYLSQFQFVVLPSLNLAPTGQVNYENLYAIKEYLTSGKTRHFAIVDEMEIEELGDVYLLRNDINDNTLLVTIEGNELVLTKKESLGIVAMQLMNDEFDWVQREIPPESTVYRVPLGSIVRFRVDYPPEIIRFSGSDNWAWDGDKQFDRVEFLEGDGG